MLELNASRARHSKNAILSLLGSAAPLVAAAVAIPAIASSTGSERFGLLMIIWTLIGYFNVFDFGLGQAITLRLSQAMAQDDSSLAAGAIFSGICAISAISLAVCALFIISVDWLVHDALRVSADLREESRRALILAGLNLPVISISAGLRGVLEAHHAFFKINLVRIPMGVYVFISPLLVIPFTVSMVNIVVILSLGRLVAFLAFCYLAWFYYPRNQRLPSQTFAEIKKLLSFGSWISVSNVVLPIMVYLDRFIIGANAGLVAVAHYATPHEIATRLRIIPTAIGAVIFPLLARDAKSGSAAKLTDMHRAAQWLTFILVFPVASFLAGFAFEVLNWWLDSAFASAGKRIVQWLSAGVLLNAIGFFFVNAARAAGNPGLVAKVHLIELPVTFFLLIALVPKYGANGAAVLFFFRWLLDTFLIGALVTRMRVIPASELAVAVSFVSYGLFFIFALSITPELYDRLLVWLLATFAVWVLGVIELKKILLGGSHS